MQEKEGRGVEGKGAYRLKGVAELMMVGWAQGWGAGRCRRT